MIGTLAPALSPTRERELVEEGRERGLSGQNLGSFAEADAWDGELASYPRKAARAYLDGFHAGRVEWLRAERKAGRR